MYNVKYSVKNRRSLRGTEMTNNNSTALPNMAALLVSVIFGFSFIFTKDALNHTSAFQLLGFRFATAALVVTLLAATGLVKIKIGPREAFNLLPVALFQPVLYFIFETLGIKLTSASESGMIIALVPVTVTIMAMFFLKERIGGLQAVFILLAVSGVMVIAAAGGGEGQESRLAGILLLTGAVLAAGFYNVFSRKASAHYSPMETTFVMMWIGAIVFNAVGLTQGYLSGQTSYYFEPLKNPRVLVDILYLGIISSVLAFFMLNFALSKLEASRAAVFMNLIPVVSVFAGVVFMKDSLYTTHLLGGILILAGVWGTNRFAIPRPAVNNTSQPISKQT